MFYSLSSQEDCMLFFFVYFFIFFFFEECEGYAGASHTYSSKAACSSRKRRPSLVVGAAHHEGTVTFSSRHIFWLIALEVNIIKYEASVITNPHQFSSSANNL